MPQCGTQVVLCDVPIRFDTYRGCSHLCRYCFASKKQDLMGIETEETPKTLAAFIRGKRSKETRWCDWDIPLHWGGLSDPFQPIEQRYRNSFRCLEVFALTGYPFVFSTKGRLAGTPEYLDLFKRCNCAGQLSLLTRQAALDLEPGAPTFNERLVIAERLAACVKRLIIRIQPYMPEFRLDILRQLTRYKEIGVYGVVVEGLKLSKPKWPCMERVAGDYCITRNVLVDHFQQIRSECHKVGLAFFCGENRLRSMGDSLCCCGVDGIDGWRVNRANLNHIYFEGTAEFAPAMQRKGSGDPFRSLKQETVRGRILSDNSYQENMLAYAKDQVGRRIYGI